VWRVATCRTRLAAGKPRAPGSLPGQARALRQVRMTGPNGEVVDVLRYTDKIGYNCVAAGGPRASHDPIRNFGVSPRSDNFSLASCGN
jgi:hypothetical protein